MVAIENEDRDQYELQLKVWEEPVPQGKYVIGCDTAYGRNDHKDRNCLSVFRCFADKIVQVAEFASADVEIKHTAWILAHLAGVYRDCIVNIEANGPGAIIMQEWDTLRGMLKSDLYSERVRSFEWQDFLGHARWYLYHRPDSLGAGYAYNSMTNNRTTYTMMHGLKGEYVTNGVLIRSMALLKEMVGVIQDGNHIGCRESQDEDAKDDRVYAAALALQAWTDWRKRELITFGLTYDLVMSQERDLPPEDPDAAARFRASKAASAVVLKFFKTREELAAQAEVANYAPKWMIDRGLA